MSVGARLSISPVGELIQGDLSAYKCIYATPLNLLLIIIIQQNDMFIIIV